MRRKGLTKDVCFIACMLMAGVAYSFDLPSSHRKKYRRPAEGVKATGKMASPAPKSKSPAASLALEPETSTGFGSGNYSYWKTGSYIAGISASPDGFVYGLFDWEPKRFNTHTNELTSPTGGSDPTGTSSYALHRTKTGSIIIARERWQYGLVGWIEKFNEGTFNFVSSAPISIPTGFEEVVTTDITSQPDGTIIVGGNAYPDGSSLNETFPWVRKFSPGLNELKANFMDFEGEIFEVAAGANGVFFACGILGNYDDSDIWIGKFNSDLELVDEKIIDTSAGGADKALSLTVDSNGDVYVTGSVYEVNGGTNAWIGRFNMNLDLIDSVTSVGTTDGTDDSYDDIVIVGSRIFVIGVRGSEDKMVSENPFKFGDMDIVMASYSKGLDLVSEHIVQGQAVLNDVPYGLSADGNGKLYVAGFTEDSTWTDEYNGDTYEYGVATGWLSQHNIGISFGDGGKPIAFPNPFRPGKGHRAMIIDKLPETGTLKLFTLKGELVREIPVTGGSASWDVKNSAGESVTSGVYFGVVDGQNSDKTFKVVIQR